MLVRLQPRLQPPDWSDVCASFASMVTWLVAMDPDARRPYLVGLRRKHCIPWYDKRYKIEQCHLAPRGT